MQTESTHQVFTMLYPLYKEEVYRRREQMMKLTAWGATGLVTMLFVLLLNPHPNSLIGIPRWLIGVAAIVWGGLFCSLIVQQQYRHQLAKQILVQLERALGFYEEGLFSEKHALYPEEWQIAWLTDKSVILYISCLAVLTALVIIALLFAPLA